MTLALRLALDLPGRLSELIQVVTVNLLKFFDGSRSISNP